MLDKGIDPRNLSKSIDPPLVKTCDYNESAREKDGDGLRLGHMLYKKKGKSYSGGHI